MRQPSYPLVRLGGLALAGLLLIPGCGRDQPRQPKPPTVDGPEATDLVAGITGLLVIEEPVGGLVGVRLPDLGRVEIRPPGRERNALLSLSGPDDQGRIVFVEQVADGFVVKSIQADGSREEVVFERSGDRPARTIGSPALAPTGGRVALVSDVETLFMKAPPETTFEEGALELWDLATGGGGKTGQKALDGSVSWFPDGNRFAYAALISPQTVEDRVFDAYFTALGQADSIVPTVTRRIPVVLIHDLAAGERKVILIGRNPLVSTDGREILLQAIGEQWILYDVAAGTSEAIDWPGRYRTGPVAYTLPSPIALVRGRRLIYRGVPTTGAPTRTTEHNSPFVGEKQMLTLKVARLGTGAFQTVIPYLDPRRDVVFGPISP
jgi:hypothetical protein